MSFKVVGVGVFAKEAFLELLGTWGIENPLAVLREAEKGRTICGQYRILASR